MQNANTLPLPPTSTVCEQHWSGRKPDGCCDHAIGRHRGDVRYRRGDEGRWFHAGAAAAAAWNDTGQAPASAACSGASARRGAAGSAHHLAGWRQKGWGVAQQLKGVQGLQNSNRN